MGNASNIELVGYSGIQVILFWIFYYIAKIYSYHIERIIFNNNMNSFKIITDNVLSLIVSFNLPIIIMNFIGMYDFRFSYTPYFYYLCIVILFILLFDINRVIRNKIVIHYENIIARYGFERGVFLTKYPPKDTFDIWIGIIAIIFLILLSLFIGNI